MRRRELINKTIGRVQPRRDKQSCKRSVHKGAVSFTDPRSKFHRLNLPPTTGSKHNRNPESQMREQIRMAFQTGALAGAAGVATESSGATSICKVGGDWN